MIRVNFRDYAINKHNQVDDYPYGGGQGMVLKPEPVFNAMEDLECHNKHAFCECVHKASHFHVGS